MTWQMFSLSLESCIIKTSLWYSFLSWSLGYSSPPLSLSSHSFLFVPVQLALLIAPFPPSSYVHCSYYSSVLTPVWHRTSWPLTWTSFTSLSPSSSPHANTPLSSWSPLAILSHTYLSHHHRHNSLADPVKYSLSARVAHGRICTQSQHIF